MKAGPTELESIVQANKGLLKPSKAGRRKATYRKEKSWAHWVEGALFSLVKLKFHEICLAHGIQQPIPSDARTVRFLEEVRKTKNAFEIN